MQTAPSSNKPKVIFLRVKTAAEKLSCLCRIVHRLFHEKQRLLIAAPSLEAAEYVDKLLWREPKESFLPHCIASSPTQEFVAITTTPYNVNQAQVLINLCPAPHPLAMHFNAIYELLDCTSAAKEGLSLQRQEDYRALGWELIEEAL